MSLFEPKKFPIRIQICCAPSVRHQDILSWGQATLGEHKVDWSMLHINCDARSISQKPESDDNRGIIMAGFKTEEDASFFTLRWSA